MTDTALRVFIGYDPRQPLAFTVLQHSIVWRASKAVSITPLVLPTLPIKRAGLTPFTFSRFLVPWLCNFDGWALFLDLDMLVLDDIAKLFGVADDRYAVLVTKNRHKFEWASSILYNCGHRANRVLTPDYVDDPERCKAPHVLDQLKESLVGELPAAWNHIVGYDEPRTDAKLVHFTQGIPAFPEIRGCEYTEQWMEEQKKANTTEPWAQLMGPSVHAVRVPDGRILPKLHPDAIRLTIGERKKPGKS